MAKTNGLEAGDYNAQIPEDVLIEILARLPVKSLIRFTCVGKSWLSLVKSPEFAAKHYETRTRLLLKAPYNCHNLVLRRDEILIERVEALFLDYETLNVSTVFQCKHVEDDGLDEYYFNDCSLYGPSKGIFCVHINSIDKPALLLWNPSTREVFWPAATPVSKHGSYLGFGFDDNTNDFKIVTFKSKKGFPHRVKVYSLTSNTWKDVEDYDYGSCKDFYLSSYTSSHGRMCNWLTYSEAYERRSLLSFNLVDEVFIETPIPNIIESRSALVLQLPHHTYPAFFADGTAAGDFDVWVLNEYGPAGCWTKHLSVTLPDHIIVSWPIVISKDEGILFKKADGVLVYYDPVNQQLNPLNVEADKVFGYTESLFIIKSYCQQVQGSDECDDEETPYYFQEIPYSPLNKGDNMGFD